VGRIESLREPRVRRRRVATRGEKRRNRRGREKRKKWPADMVISRHSKLPDPTTRAGRGLLGTYQELSGDDKGILPDQGIIVTSHFRPDLLCAGKKLGADRRWESNPRHKLAHFCSHRLSDHSACKEPSWLIKLSSRRKPSQAKRSRAASVSLRRRSPAEGHCWDLLEPEGVVPAEALGRRSSAAEGLYRNSPARRKQLRSFKAFARHFGAHRQARMARHRLRSEGSSSVRQLFEITNMRPSHAVLFPRRPQTIRDASARAKQMPNMLTFTPPPWPAAGRTRYTNLSLTRPRPSPGEGARSVQGVGRVRTPPCNCVQASWKSGNSCHAICEVVATRRLQDGQFLDAERARSDGMSGLRLKTAVPMGSGPSRAALAVRVEDKPAKAAPSCTIYLAAELCGGAVRLPAERTREVAQERFMTARARKQISPTPRARCAIGAERR